jgi:hypothetical protein
VSAIGCRVGWHKWNQWQWVPATDKHPAEDGWMAGQIRNCVNCHVAQVKKFSGLAFNVNWKPQPKTATSTPQENPNE